MKQQLLQNAALEYSLGILPKSELSTWALKALDHVESPELIQLAIENGGDGENLDSLFRKAMTKLGIEIPSEKEAALLLAKKYAREICEGKISPYEGARKIWSQIYVKFPCLSQVRPFVGYASEYEDDPAHREFYAEKIQIECEKLLQTETCDY